MASIQKDMHLAAPLARVWDALRDFNNVHTRVAPGFVVDSKAEEGARIVTFSNGSVARERLVTCDEGLHRLVYSVSSERVTHHNASVVLEADGAGCRLVWTTDVLPDAIAPYIDAQMTQAFVVMKQTLDRA